MNLALENVKIRILDNRLGRDWPLPKYETEGSAGLDLRACLEKPFVLAPKQQALVSSGLAFFIDNSQYCGKILPRSGLGHKHGIILGNGTGLIDADYQGPLMMSLWNRSDQDYTIAPGDRIAQLIFVPVARPALEIVDDFDETARGSGGFGSTGVTS